MNCSNCGQPLAPNDLFCQNCGTPRPSGAARFEQVENEYFRLKGLVATGRMTPSQFESALKELMFQDAQGRWWMVGADSGKWYVNDGQNWVLAQPPGASPTQTSPVQPPAPPQRSVEPTPLSVAATPVAPLPTAPLPTAPLPARRSCALPVLAIIGSVFLCLVLAVGAILLAPSLGLQIALGSTPTFSLPPVVPTIMPPPLSTSTPILVVVTLTPPASVPLPPTIDINPPLPTVATLPTIDISPRSPTVIVAPPTATPIPPTATAMSVPPAATPAPPTPTRVIPAGLYVTNLRIEPGTPTRNQDISFVVTFLNTASGEQNMSWLVYIYRADNPRQPFGQISSLRTTFPVGPLELRGLGTWKITGGGGCENFIARPVWLNESKVATQFITTDGTPFEFPFTVCP